MDLLKREIAPILPAAWAMIDAEARRVLELHLAARKLVDFCGPFGWEHAAVNTGRLDPLHEGPVPDVSVSTRRVQPLLELRSPFRLDLAELDTVARGANDLDLRSVVRAAEAIARAEDGAVFNGYGAGGVVGILEACPHPEIVVGAAGDWPRAVARAKESLWSAGVSGPYALALGAKAYEEISTETEGGYPIRKHVEKNLIDGPIVWAPAIDGGVMLSMRGGDFELTSGQDLAIGYAHHNRHEVELYLVESFAFRVLDPTAAVRIRRG